MKQIFDEKSANEVYRANSAEKEHETKRRNFILSLNNTNRKQSLWQKEFNHSLAIYGLSKEQLKTINETVW